MTLVLGALDGELSVIAERLEAAVDESWSGYPVLRGRLSGPPPGEEIVLGRTGVGKVQAALLAQHLIDVYAPDRIVMVGVAGSLTRELDVGDVVVADASVQHDMDVTSLGFAPGEIPYTAHHRVPCSPALRREALAAGPHESERVVAGTIVSGDQFIDQPERKAWLTRTFAAPCVEMEGAAVGLVAAVNTLPFCLIRVISDHADGKAARFEDVLALAARRAWHYLSGMFARRKASDPYFNDAERLVALMESVDEFILVDTRERDEWDEGYLPGAIHIPYEQIGERPPTADKGALIIVYCHSGARSETAKRTLTTMGYTNVYNFGGVIHWPGEFQKDTT